MQINLIYITVKDKPEAERIGRFLVQERIASAVNIIPAVHSIYRWDDQIRESSETLLIAKTKEKLSPYAIEKIKEQHGYECPCILSLAVEEGHPAFLQWVYDETL